MHSSGRPVVIASSHSPRCALGVAILTVGLIAALWTNGGTAMATTSPEVRLELTTVSEATVSADRTRSKVIGTIANVGTTAATGVTVTYHLPDSVDAMASSTSSNCGSITSTEVLCTIGAIAAGGSAEVSIGVTAAPGTTPGVRLGYFSAPTSGQFDPAAGEIRMRTWEHEADGQGANPLDCWPVENASPNMDVAGGGSGLSSLCDGSNDAPSLAPDDETILTAFPEPYSEPVGHSWEWFTTITPPSDGLYSVCGYGVDDGGYVAVAPIGETLATDDVVFTTSVYGSSQSAAFALDAGDTQQVLIRVMNRGGPGVDNGGAAPGGWNSIGIVEGTSCTTAASSVFGTSESSWVRRSASRVVVPQTTDLAITGAIIRTEASGVTTSAARIENLGDATATPLSRFTLADVALSSTTAAGCIIASGDDTAECVGSSLTGGSTSVVSVGYEPGTRALAAGGWTTTATDALDSDLSNNFAPGW